MRQFNFIHSDIYSQDDGLFLYSESYMHVVFICCNELEFLTEYVRNANKQNYYTF